jgi:hypothetical protein
VREREDIALPADYSSAGLDCAAAAESVFTSLRPGTDEEQNACRIGIILNADIEESDGKAALSSVS